MSTKTTRRDLEQAIVKKATKDAEYRQRLVADPHAGVVEVVKEIDPDVEVQQGMEVKVFEEPENAFYLVLPRVPKAQVEISDEDLEKVAGGLVTDEWGDATVIIGF